MITGKTEKNNRRQKLDDDILLTLTRLHLQTTEDFQQLRKELKMVNLVRMC